MKFSPNRILTLMHLFAALASIFLALLSYPLHAREQSYTLMLTPEEIKEFTQESSQSAPFRGVAHGLYLGGIIYKSPRQWIVWMNDRKFSPLNSDAAFDILDVNPSSVKLIWTIKNKSYEIQLSPNQTFDADSEQILQGDCRLEK